MKDGEDLYFDFTKEEKDHAIRYLLGAVLRSRAASGFPSNDRVYDEDVNIYLAHLLFAISTSGYQKLVNKYLVIYQMDLVNLVETSDDNYIRYFIYKINADNLLVHLSVFQDLAHKVRDRHDIAGTTAEDFMETARSYYEHAAHYNQRIYRRKTAVGEVLSKLASHFDMYCSILQITRKDYFHFANQFKDREFSSFVKGVNGYEREQTLRERQDAFLDLYLEWTKDKGNAALTRQLNEMAEGIRELDPEFQFRAV